MAIAITISSLAVADEAGDEYQFGYGLYQKENWKLAAETFGKFLDKHPQHPRASNARLHLGFSLEKLKKYREAREQFRTFVKQYPQNKNRADAMYRVAECSYFLGDLISAEKEFDRFLAANPKHDFAEWALPYLGDAQLRLKKAQAAAATFQKSLDAHPDSRMADDARFGLAGAFTSLQQTDKAIDVYKRLAADRNGARAADAQLKLGTLYFDAGKFKLAASTYVEFDEKFRGSRLLSTAQLNAGYAYHQLGEYPKAILQFKLAAKDKKQTILAGYWQGLSLHAVGDDAQAAAVFKSSFGMKEDGPLAGRILYQWADSELSRRRFDEAERLYLDYVKRWPRGELADDSLHFAAEAALLDGRLRDAETLIGRFERAYPQSALRMYQRLLKGRLANAGGDENGRRTALGHFQKVLEDSTVPRTRSLARRYLAETYQQLGEHAKAIEALTPLVTELKKAGRRSEFADVLLLFGRSQLAMKDYDAAIESASEYLELNAEAAGRNRALALRAEARASAGRQEAADADLTSLGKRQPPSPIFASATHRVAEIAYAAEDWKWATKLFQSLVDLGNESPYHVAGLSGLGWSRYQAKDYGASAETFAQLLKDHSDHKTLAPEAAYMRGKALQDAGESADAAAAYAAAFQSYAPTSAAKAGEELSGSSYFAYRAGLQAARVLRSSKRIEDSDAAYEQLLERFPKPKNLDKLLDEWALLNYEAERFDEADAIFLRLVRETPRSERADDARYHLAESDLIAGRLTAARDAFRSLEASSQADEKVQEDSLYRLVGIAMEQQQWKDVRNTVGQLTKRFPKSTYRPEAEFRLAEAELSSKRPDAAQKLLLKLRDEADNSKITDEVWFPLVRVRLAETYYKQMKYDDVLKIVEALRKEDPESSVLYQADEVLGRSYKNRAKFEEARASFKRAINAPAARKTETAAKSQFLLAETFLIQAKAHRTRKETGKAERAFKSALTEYLKVYHLHMEFPEWQTRGLFQAAACYEVLGEWADAVKAYEDLLKEFPKSEYTESAKRRLEKAQREAGR